MEISQNFAWLLFSIFMKIWIGLSVELFDLTIFEGIIVLSD
jgi:hypothetical protein